MKEVFSLIAIILTLTAYYPYILSIHRGQTRPHYFSWLVWGLTTIIVYLAQVEEGAGVGAWPVLLSGIITFYIALLGFLKRSDLNISMIDFLFFTISLLAIPLWYVTDDPLWAVVLVSAIDVSAFVPTLRKASIKPEQEDISFYFIFLIRCAFVLLALERYSLATVLFPLSVGFCCLLMVLMLTRKNTERKVH